MEKNSISQFFRYATIGTLALTLALSSCKRKKDDTTDPDPDLTTERDISNADNDLNSVMGDIDKAFDSGNGSSLRLEGGYATLTWSSITPDTTINGNVYNKKLVVTYSGASAEDGQLRNGSATVFFAGTRPAETLGYYAIFTGSKVGGRSITGTQTVKQMADNNDNTWTFNIDASGTLTTIDGRKIAYTSTRKRVRTGIATANISDDSFAISGSWTGTNADGESVTANIASALQLSYGCHSFREITAGKIDFSNNSRGITRSIDYGSGSCDGLGTFINAKGRAFTFAFYR